MSEDQLKAFLEKVKRDTSLRDKLKAAISFNEAIALAKDTGFSLSVEDVQSSMPDVELEAIAGGGARTATGLSYCCSIDECPKTVGGNCPR